MSLETIENKIDNGREDMLSIKSSLDSLVKLSSILVTVAGLNAGGNVTRAISEVSKDPINDNNAAAYQRSREPQLNPDTRQIPTNRPPRPD